MTVIAERLAVIDGMQLSCGAHRSIEQGVCALEAVAFIAGEPWSDHPQCVSNVIASFMRSWNDAMPDADRQMLKPLIPMVVGTRTTTNDDQTRAWMATDWLARECAPAWLRLAGLTEHADTLEQLAPVLSARTAAASQEKLNAAWDAAWDAAGDAAGYVAWDAVWDAARAAAWDAARAAAWDAAWAAARAAAGDAAWAAAGYVAWDATRDAARDAARAAAGYVALDAAWAAARAAAGYVALDATRVAAKNLFNPTARILQASAYRLDERMCAVGRSD
jgi:hypothetical protein